MCGCVTGALPSVPRCFVGTQLVSGVPSTHLGTCVDVSYSPSLPVIGSFGFRTSTKVFILPSVLKIFALGTQFKVGGVFLPSAL